MEQTTYLCFQNHQISRSYKAVKAILLQTSLFFPEREWTCVSKFCWNSFVCYLLSSYLFSLAAIIFYLYDVINDVIKNPAAILIHFFQGHGKSPYIYSWTINNQQFPVILTYVNSFLNTLFEIPQANKHFLTWVTLRKLTIR